MLVTGQFYEFCEFMMNVMVLHCGVVISQFVGRVIGDDVVAHCVLFVVAFV